MFTKTRSLALGTALVLATCGTIDPAPAQAQDAVPATDQNSLEEITVTARRRDESIVDVPLAITVVTAAQLDKLGVTSTSDLANFVPGLQFSDFTPGNSRNDRGGNRPLIFRGLNLSNNGGVTGAGSMFLDGAAVIGNEIPGGLDIGAVEVLRGPQNVYFGRASMTGAVSYRTKAIPEQWESQVDITLAQRDTHRVEASTAGKLASGILGVRLTGLSESNDGYITNDFNNGAGEKLGARSRDSISATVEIKPTDSLAIKLYANRFEDVDGMAATVNIFPQIANCLLPGATRRMICGEVPGIQNAVNWSNTVIPTRDANVLFAVPFLQDEGFKRQAGMQRNVLNTHVIVDFSISDYLKLQSITGYHTNAVEQAGDGIQQPVNQYALYSAYFYNLANRFSDSSQELRLSSDPERALSWTVGANYVKARNESTAVVTFTSSTNPSFVNGNSSTPGVFVPFPQNLGDDSTKTYGYFAGAYLKLMDERLTLSAEARQQVDERRTITRNSGGALLSDLSDKFKSFNPRVSVDYDVGGQRKVYASVASGTRPGGFNAGLLVYYDPANPIYTRTTPAPLNFQTVTQSITSTFGVTDPTYAEEKLEIAELGFKGGFAGGKGFFDINAYYGTVSDQQIRKSLVVPALGFSLGAVTNTGETEIYGLEWSGNYRFTGQLSLATSLAWNHAKRTTYLDASPATIAQFGFSDFSGLELPNTPKVTGSAVLSYDDQLSGDWNWFGNTAIVYRGKQWADLGNVSYIPGRTTVDLRAGVSNDSYRIEAFVTNLFDDDTYPGGNVAPDFGGNGGPGVAGGPNVSVQYHGFFGAFAVPRTIGARFSVKF
jgi:iron complex outermembrane receptor protein